MPHPHRDCVYFEYKIVHGGSTVICNSPDVKPKQWSGGAGESDCTWQKCKYYSKTQQIVIQTTLGVLVK